MNKDNLCRISNREITYVFSIPSTKFSIVQGNSATGKTKFSEMVSRYTRAIRSNLTPTITYKGGIQVISFAEFIRNPGHTTNSLVIIDEDEYDAELSRVGVNLYTTFTCSNNYFMIITRDVFAELDMDNEINDQLRKKFYTLPISLSSLYCVEYNKDSNTNFIVPIYPNKFTDFYKKGTLIKNVIVEDTMSRALFFSQYFKLIRDENLFVAGGKEQVVSKLIQQIDRGVTDILIVFDACAFGLLIQRLLYRISMYHTAGIYQLDWESFEHYLLQSENIQRLPNIQEEINDMLEYMTTSVNGNKPLTVEKAYARILNHYLKLYTKKGSDGTCNCLRLGKDYFCNNCFKYARPQSREEYAYICPVLEPVDQETGEILICSPSEKEFVYIHEPLDKFEFSPTKDSNTDIKSDDKPPDNTGGGLKAISF